MEASDRAREWLYNILITPLVPFRAITLLVAYGLLWVGENLEEVGGAIPGWRRAARRKPPSALKAKG